VVAEHGPPTKVITYEYPLVERIRTMLRLEHLFERASFFLERGEPPAHHAALLTLFEVLEVAGRADLKSDLLQELDRQKQIMVSFRNNPDIDQQVLVDVLRDIEHAHSGLYNIVGKIGQHLRENEWLMGIKQRTGIPGGACEFDLPSYHHWLHRDAAARLRDLTSWAAPLYPIRDGAALVLKLLRESGKPARLTAPGGTFQQMLGGRAAQMVRVRLALEADCVPEISANKYALNIRFVTAGADPRPRTCERDVDFELTFCSL
jgi:cell division protein ZapD